MLFLDSPELRCSIYTYEVRWSGGFLGRAIVGIVPAEGHLGQFLLFRPCFFKPFFLNSCPHRGAQGALGEPWGALGEPWGALGEPWGPLGTQEEPFEFRGNLVILLKHEACSFNVLIFKAFQRTINSHSRDLRGALGTRAGLLKLVGTPATAFKGSAFEPSGHPWGSLGSPGEVRNCF